MNAFYQNYSARNEVTTSVDTSVPVIELGHTSSLLRPLSIGTDWNRLAIYFKMAISGSPATGNLTGAYLFVGLCSGNKRFSQNSGSLLGTHAIGIASNSSTSSTDWSATTDPMTDPPNRNMYHVAVGIPIIMATGSIVATTSTDRMTAPRYETVWTSSLPSASIYNNAFLPYGIVIEKPVVDTNVHHPTTWAVTQVTYVIVPFYQSTASIHCPASAYTQDRLIVNNPDGQIVAGFQTNLIVKSFNMAQQAFYDVDAVQKSPNTASFGDFDTFNVYYSCTGYPQSKVLIKDIFIIRMC